MPTTSNFGWTTPADTDLVKDGAAAIRTLGNGIDTSLVDLKGGTTGQVLSKTSNTDLDYTWVTPNVGDITEVQAGTGISVASGTGPIPVITNTVATAFDAAGDLVYGTGADTFTKLALGTAGQVLTVNSGATAPQWSTATSGGLTLLSTTSLSGTSTAITIAPTGYVNLLVVFKGIYASANNTVLSFRLNSDSGNNYSYVDWRRYPGATSGDFQAGISQNQQYMGSAGIGTSSGVKSFTGAMTIYRCNDTSQINYEFTIMCFNDSDVGTYQHTIGKYTASAAITNLTMVNTINANTLSGTVYVYGVK
jgi:hypothetical protein